VLNADEITAGRGGEVSVEGGAHGGNKGRRDRGVQRKGQFAIFEKTCGGEVLAADDERGVVGEQDFFAVIVFWCCSALDHGAADGAESIKCRRVWCCGPAMCRDQRGRG
jgi:hypothetical protein